MWRVLLLMGCVGMLLGNGSLAAASHAVPAQQAATLTPTPVPGTKPDSCEPDNTLVQPCAIPAEVDITDLTFVDDSIDVYSVLLKAGHNYIIRAASMNGIDPSIALYLAGATEKPIAQNDDAAVATTDAIVQLTTTTAGWYLIQVTNQASGSMVGRTYTLSVRSRPSSESVPTSMPTSPTRGDAFENNYDPDHAPLIGWGVPYDLSLICPDPRPDACISGDHDFFLVPVKAGIPFVALSYDVGPGVDTAIALYQPTPGWTDPSTHLLGWKQIAGNDDAIQGKTLRSQVLITPTWSGSILLIVAPSGRMESPRVPEAVGPPGRYRLMVGSPFLPAVQQVLAAQATADGVTTNEASGSGNHNIPTPTPMTPLGPTIMPTVTVAGDAEEVIRESCIIGTARVSNPDGARFSAAAVPASHARILMIYPKGTDVILLGSCYLGWVKVRPMTAVSPGWMYAPDLALVEARSSVTETLTTSETNPPDPANPNMATTIPQPSHVVPTLRPIQVAPLPTSIPLAPTSLPRQALTVVVQVVDGQHKPRIGMRVQLVDVLGAVLREGATDDQGTISLVVDLSASAAVWVQLPAVGLTVPVDRAKPALVLTVPSSIV